MLRIVANMLRSVQIEKVSSRNVTDIVTISIVKLHVSTDLSMLTIVYTISSSLLYSLTT